MKSKVANRISENTSEETKSKVDKHVILLQESKKYNEHSIQLQGKGVDRYIDYIEWENGEPLTDDEIEDLKHNQELHSLLIQQYFLR